MPQVQDFEEYHRAEDGEYATWRVQSNRLAQSVAEASEDGWDCLSIAPYSLTANDNTSTVSAYLLLLWREA